MRDISELLELLKDQIVKCPEALFQGMCGEVEVMNGEYGEMFDIFHNINLQERNILFDYFTNNKPTNVRMYNYWWKCGSKKPRMEWIDEHIKLLTK